MLWTFGDLGFDMQCVFLCFVSIRYLWLIVCVSRLS